MRKSTNPHRRSTSSPSGTAIYRWAPAPAATFFSPFLLPHGSIPLTMLKRLILFIAIFSLICAIQCTPTPVDRDRSRPSTGFKRDGRNRPSSRPKRDGWDRRDRPSSRPKRDGRGKPSSRPKRDGLVGRDRPSSRPKRDGLVGRDRPSSRPKRDGLVGRDRPSSRPHARSEDLEARGICDFGCPQENLAGTGLSAMYEDTGRLYCKYDVEGMASTPFCMYNRVRFSRQKILSCHDAYSPFHLLRTPEISFRPFPLLTVTSRQRSTALVRKMVRKT